jgi:hypothetical protein
MASSRNGVIALIACEPHVKAFISHLRVNVIVYFIFQGFSQLNLIILINLIGRLLFKCTFITAASFNLIFK